MKDWKGIANLEKDKIALAVANEIGRREATARAMFEPLNAERRMQKEAMLTACRRIDESAAKFPVAPIGEEVRAAEQVLADLQRRHAGILPLVAKADSEVVVAKNKLREVGARHALRESSQAEVDAARADFEAAEWKAQDARQDAEGLASAIAMQRERLESARTSWTAATVDHCRKAQAESVLRVLAALKTLAEADERLHEIELGSAKAGVTLPSARLGSNFSGYVPGRPFPGAVVGKYEQALRLLGFEVP